MITQLGLSPLIVTLSLGMILLITCVCVGVLAYVMTHAPDGEKEREDERQ